MEQASGRALNIACKQFNVEIRGFITSNLHRCRPARNSITFVQFWTDPNIPLIKISHLQYWHKGINLQKVEILIKTIRWILRVVSANNLHIWLW